MKEGLSKQVLVNSLWSIFGRFGYLSISLISNIILVRLLSPKEFGQLGVAMFFIIVGSVLTEAGLSGALIRKEHVTENDYSTVFIFNLIVSLMLMLMLMLSAGSISSFYNDNDLKYILIISSLVFLVNAFRIVQDTKLIREMKFKSKITYEFFSIFLSSGIAVFFAFKGAGIWSLILLQILTPLFLAMIMWYFVGSLKTYKFSFLSFKGFFKFGINTTLASLLNVVFNNIYHLVLGKYFSIIQTGYFYQAQKLQDIPNSVSQGVILNVMYSALSKLKGDSKDFVEFYQNTFKLFAVIIAFVCMVIFNYAEVIVRLLYGEKWIASVIYLKVLIFISFFYLLEILSRNIFKVFDKTEKILQLEILKKIMQMGTIIYGVVTMSIVNLLYGFAYVCVFSFLINYFFVRKILGISDINDLIVIFKISLICVFVILFLNNGVIAYGYLEEGSILSFLIIVAAYALLLKIFKIVDLHKFLNIKKILIEDRNKNG